MTERQSGWLLNQPHNRPDVDPILLETIRMGAPINPHDAVLYHALSEE